MAEDQKKYTTVNLVTDAGFSTDIMKPGVLETRWKVEIVQVADDDVVASEAISNKTDKPKENKKE